MYNPHLANATETEFRIYGIALPILSILSVVCNIFVFAVLLREFVTHQEWHFACSFAFAQLDSK